MFWRKFILRIKYFIYFLLTLEERISYIKGLEKGGQVIDVYRDKGKYVYVYDMSKKPKRNFLNFKEFIFNHTK